MNTQYINSKYLLCSFLYLVKCRLTEIIKVNKKKIYFFFFMLYNDFWLFKGYLRCINFTPAPLLSLVALIQLALNWLSAISIDLIPCFMQWLFLLHVVKFLSSMSNFLAIIYEIRCNWRRFNASFIRDWAINKNDPKIYNAPI